MVSQTFLKFMVIMTSQGNNLHTVIRKCSNSNRTLFVACNGLGSGCLTSPSRTIMRSDSEIFQPIRSQNYAYSEPICSTIARASRVLTRYDIPKDRSREYFLPLLHSVRNFDRRAILFSRASFYCVRMTTTAPEHAVSSFSRTKIYFPKNNKRGFSNMFTFLDFSLYS